MKLSKILNYRLLLLGIIASSTFGGCLFHKLTLPPGRYVQGWFKLDKPGPFKIGDPIPLTLTLETGTGIRVETPILNESTFKDLEIQKVIPSKPETFQNGSRLKIHYLLTAWQTGKCTVPSIKVVYQDQFGKRSTYNLPGINLEVISVLPGNKDQAQVLALDIKPVKKPVGLSPRYLVLACFLAAYSILALLMLLGKILAKKLTAGINQPTTPLEPAHIIALRRLDLLQAAGHLEKGAFKIFYSELAECIREYIELRYGIKALEMTTEELLAEVSGGALLDQAQQQLLRRFLSRADLVKFAGQTPTVVEANHFFNGLKDFIETTKELPNMEPTGAKSA